MKGHALAKSASFALSQQRAGMLLVIIYVVIMSSLFGECYASDDQHGKDPGRPTSHPIDLPR